MGLNARFELQNRSTKSEGLASIAALLEEESVEFQIESACIKSTRIPIVFLGVDKRIYSKRNWVGVNPFVFVSAVEVQFCENSTGCSVQLRIDRTRTAVICGIACFNVALVAFAAPLKMIPVLCVILTSFLVILWYLSGLLISREISNGLVSKTSCRH